jgi:hypothetical protein
MGARDTDVEKRIEENSLRIESAPHDEPKGVTKFPLLLSSWLVL